ncbi:MAG: hypothetical protein ACON4Z_18090 [Planctomycetota bacterium]
MTRRPWTAAAALALAAVYLPTLLPLVVGPLRHSAGSVASYLRVAPILPGFAPGALVSQATGAPVPVAAAVFTALILAGMLLVARRRHLDDALAVAAVLGLLVGVESFFLGVALRA